MVTLSGKGGKEQSENQETFTLRIGVELRLSPRTRPSPRAPELFPVHRFHATPTEGQLFSSLLAELTADFGPTAASLQSVSESRKSSLSQSSPQGQTSVPRAVRTC